MKYILTLVLLSGCGFVTAKRMKACEKACEKNEGARNIGFFLGDDACACVNGALFSDWANEQ